MARSEKSENKNRVLGLDIGNGYGYVSLLENPKNDPIPLLPASLSTQGMPTTAYVKPPNGEQIDVFSDGRAAEQKYARTPQQLVYAAKTRLPELTLKIPGIERPVQAGHIYAAAAHDLLVLAEKELANKGIPPVYDVVFTFPAAFADNVPVLEIMQENLGKVEINGKPIQVLSRLPEPAAVAIDYLHYMQHIAPEQIRIKKNEFTVLVYDLGHGTFDTAIVTAQSEGTPYKMHAKDGLEEVGGKDFDNVLYQELLSVLQKQYGFEPQNEIQRAEIMREAVKAKIALTDDNSYLASVMNQQNEYCEVEITRERFEKLSEPLVFQTLEVVQKMLEEAEEKGITIDAKEKRAAEIHDEMCANTNTVQAKFIAALEDNIEKLETVKSDFYTNIHSWQKSLYPVEYEPIAQNFQELYRLVNVDPLIRMELLAEGTSTNMLKELEKLKKTLSTFLHRFESSLHGLDMYVYYPEAGEMYDALWHLPENEADCTGGHVVTCIVPGVARKAADQVDDDVVLPAVVKVEMSKEE